MTLRELQEAFRRSVLCEEGALPCWYGTNVDTPLKCEGRIIASHLIKRQRVRKAVSALFNWGAEGTEAWNDLSDLLQQAEWDPRNAFPSCRAHDDRWDGIRMPPLPIPRSKLPQSAIEFMCDYGLDFELERRFEDA